LTDSTLLLGSIQPNLIYTLDLGEQVDTNNSIGAHIGYELNERFLFVKCSYEVDLVEISLHKKNGEFKEFIMNEKLNIPCKEMRFIFPDTDLPRSGEVLRIKLNGLTHYFMFLNYDTSKCKVSLF
jgi:hypothetical protein